MTGTFLSFVRYQLIFLIFLFAKIRQIMNNIQPMQKEVKQHQTIHSNKHTIKPEQIPRNASKVLNRLHEHGFQAYLVGGCVRDLLLNHHPKDFDIATDARPEQIQDLFKNCRLIGRRFRLAHVYFKEGLIEVATFRGTDPKHHRTSSAGLLLRDNVYGTLQEDAYRRDFTINALYYDIKHNIIIDYTNGFEDLQNGCLSIIGDPHTRYREDPVRMIRAARFSAKLNMELDDKTHQPIFQQGHLLQEVSSSRLFDEVVKLFHTGHAHAVLGVLFNLQLMPQLFPDLCHLLSDPVEHSDIYQFLEKACWQTDQRIQQGKGVSCVFLFAVLLWPVVINNYLISAKSQNDDPETAFSKSAHLTLRRQSWITSIPKRFNRSLNEIWYLQFELIQARAGKVDSLLTKSRFRAGFDLLLLRSHIRPKLKPWGEWWHHYQQLTNPNKQKQMLKKIPKPRKKFDF